ncbi:hypothetical protein [Frankia tisae]|uniref:hypothetical protein n=1 Tax=Frankia tisae TaxID=2950104 RepID=UPI0021C20E87|nr:hypothetical protein [Frankia tisae]
MAMRAILTQRTDASTHLLPERRPRGRTVTGLDHLGAGPVDGPPPVAAGSGLRGRIVTTPRPPDPGGAVGPPVT